MKILHILQGFSLGGASRSVVAIAKDATLKQLDQVHCAISLTPAHPQAVKLAEDAGLQVIEAPNLDIINREIAQADIVHIHFWNTPEIYQLLQLNLPPMRLLVWLKVVGDRSPHIVTSELVDYADILLATTPYSLEIPAIKSRSDLFTNNQIGVVPGIADFSRLESLKNRPHPGFNVGYIGTVDFSKLYQNYIPMSAGVQVPDIRFIVCGGGIENSLKQQAESLGVAEKFEFRGYVEDIKSVLEILDVFGYPLVEDTYATSEKSLQEAMYAGVTPVVFPHGGVKGLVINNQTGLVVNSEKEYQEAIAYLYHHPQERLRLGNNARNYAKKYFNPQVSLEKINQTYHQLMKFPKRERRLNTGNPQTGAALFVQSLGDIDPQFRVSLTSNNISEQLESDRHISTASPGLCNPGGGGLFHYRNCYPKDGYLRFWSALVLQKQGRHHEAINEFYQAWENGCHIWRVLWYLANSAEKIGNHNLAQQAINRVLELIPNFTPATDMKKRINSLSATPTKPPVNHAQLNLQRQFWNVDSIQEAMFARVLTYPGIEKLSPAERQQVWEQSIYRTTEQILKGIPSQPHWQVLEIGCGVGRLIKPLRQKFNRVDGVDISENMIEFAKQYLADGQSNGELYVNNGCDLQDLPGEFYDFVYSTIVFQHIRSLSVVKSYLSEIFRVLKPGGYFRIQVHDRSAENLGNFDEEGAENQQYYLCGNAYTDTQLRDLLIAAGFNLISLECAKPWIWSTVQRPETRLKSPKVSAIVSTYNSAKFMEGCLPDLVNQTLYHKQQLEIIVIDSNSQENEAEIVANFQAKYPYIIYHRTEHRETLYTAWNRALELAKGEYITNANTDDRHRLDALELMANYLDQHSDIAVVYGDQLITNNPNETFENTQANQRWNWPEFSYQELERRCCLGSQPMWRKSLHQKYGNFNPEFKVAGDYEFWLRIGKTEKIAKIPEILGLYFQNDRGLENADHTAELELNQILNQYGITQRVIQRKTSIPVSCSPSFNPDQPLVSVIIPCYNQGQYLDEAIASVVAQTYSNWECWIINDGSQDQTNVVVKRWLEKYRDRQLNLIETPNQGVVRARNLGLSKSRGELILCLDADDKIHPEFIAEACQILSKYPQVGFVYSDIQHFGENHETVSHGDFDLQSFLQQNQAPVTSLFRAEIYRQIGGFKTLMEAGWEDWEFWISACEIGWLGYRLPKPYLFYRQHSSGSRLQTLSSDRTTLAIQKAKIIQLHPKLYNVDAFIWSHAILNQLESVSNPVSPMKPPTFPSILPVSNSINRPLWSIMIPTYNGDTYLEETLNSILEQDLDPQNTEIEVVDDCSTQGNTEAIVKTVGRGRVKFYRQPQNLGLVENWNACINRSRGHWVHILHQDDRVLPGFYHQMQQVFEAFPQVGAVFCRHYYIDESGKLKLLSNLEQENPGILNNWLERIAVRQEIQFPSIVVRRSVYEHLGGFYPPVGYAADWEMWKRIATHYPVGYQPTPLACWRMHSFSASSRSIKQAKDMADLQHSIDISASYLPPEKTANLSRQAQENYSLYALQTARKFLESGQANEAIAQIRAALKLSQSPQVRDRVIALFIESELDTVIDPQKLAVQVDLAVQQYQNNPQDSDILNKLRSLRHQVTELWLKLPTEKLPQAYQEHLGKVHKSLLNSGIKNEIFRDDERLYFQEIKSYLSQGFKQQKSLQYLLAGMLYGRADQLMLPFEESLIPTWLAEDYFRFLFEVPPLFQEIGDADNYSRYRIRLLDFVRERLQQQPDYPLWQKLTNMLLERGNFIPNYFADFNLKPLFCSRADLFEVFLKTRGFQLDYSFPERPSDRQKIRLGIINDHLNPQTETYLTLPAFEYLNREQFEIILYVTQANNHPLEQYCRSRADRLVRLPDDKLQQVATIRADDLDILLFGTNVTAITKPVTLLALHRLARVQATLFSSPVTTGMRYMDYYISGHLSEGADAPNFYRENLAVLNGTGFCFNYYAIAPQPATVKPHRSQWGANDQTIVFMSGANFYKIIPEQGETWVKILAQVPNSILVLYPFALSWSSNYASSQFIRRMYATLSKYRVEQKRLVLIKTLPSRSDVKACLEQGDIYLDSYPHSGSNSLVDPLEVGLPVVVRDGDTLRSKHGAAMMRSLGIPDLITDSESSYISLAITLANTPELRQLKRQAIQQKMAANPEFLDSRAYSAKMGALLTQIFQNYQSQQQVIDLYNPQKRQQFLAEVVDQVNLYELDPNNTMVVNKLRKIRRDMVEYWLRQPPEQLENLYQQQMGKGYQILLNRGIQKQPLTDEEQALVKTWTKTAMGLTEPHAINCLMAVMLYSQPGKMLVRDAVNRLPAWLLPDYQRLFENADAIAQIKQTLATTQTQPTSVNSPQVTPNITAVDVSTFVNRLIGCVKLFNIDPTDTNITVELRQLRWQFAQFWLNLPEQKLEEMYQSPLGDGYRSLLNSRLQNEMLTQHEWDFLQQVGTYLRQGLDTPRSLNYLMVAMLYYRPEQLQIKDLSRLPSYLQRDYQNWHSLNS